MRAQEWLEQTKQEERNKGLEQGLEQGLELLVHLYERRMNRRLSSGERQTLLERFERLGPERLGDVALDLAPAALDAWLAQPDAF